MSENRNFKGKGPSIFVETAVIVGGMLLAIFGPVLANPLPVLVRVLLSFAGVIMLLGASILLVFRELGLWQKIKSYIYITRRKAMDVYIFLHASPKASNTVAQQLPELCPSTVFSVAVWGAPDVVARAKFDNKRQLYDVLDKLHMNPQVVATETYLVRSDQLELNQSPQHGTRIAFILLKVRPAYLKAVLQATSQMEWVVDSAGTLGPADVILNVRYETDEQLTKLVMQRIQDLQEIQNTETILGIQGMAWPSP